MHFFIFALSSIFVLSSLLFFLLFCFSSIFSFLPIFSFLSELPRLIRGRSFLLHSPRLLSHLQETDKVPRSSFFQSPQAFPISLPDPTIELSHPYICSLSILTLLSSLHRGSEATRSGYIDRSVFITIMFCSTNRTDPGMNVQVLDFLILVSTDIA